MGERKMRKKTATINTTVYLKVKFSLTSEILSRLIINLMEKAADRLCMTVNGDVCATLHYIRNWSCASRVILRSLYTCG